MSSNSFGNVTAIIKTFMRDGYFYECIRSLKERHPDIKIFVIDDGKRNINDKTSLQKLDYVDRFCDEFIEMDFDTGLPKARNTLLRMVETDYILIGDDDFYYTHDLNPLLKLMEVADVAGGRIIENDEVKNYQGFIGVEGDAIKCRELPLGDYLKHDDVDYKPCDFTFNFFIARKSAIPEWDEGIKICWEHEDFFLAAKEKGTRVVFCPTALVDHKPSHVEWTMDDKLEYLKFRDRRSDKAYFLNKWGVKRFIDTKNVEDHI